MKLTYSFDTAAIFFYLYLVVQYSLIDFDNNSLYLNSLLCAIVATLFFNSSNTILGTKSLRPKSMLKQICFVFFSKLLLLLYI